MHGTMNVKYNLPPTRPLATLEGGCCYVVTMTCTRGCSYSFMYSWWWVRWNKICSSCLDLWRMDLLSASICSVRKLGSFSC